MEGNLIIVAVGEDITLEFAQMIFNYPSVVRVITEPNKEIQNYAYKNNRQVIQLSEQEALELFGADITYRIGNQGENLDLELLGADLKEGKTIMLIFGSENPDTTIEKWVGDIAAITIILYDLEKLIEL